MSSSASRNHDGVVLLSDRYRVADRALGLSAPNRFSSMVGIERTPFSRSRRIGRARGFAYRGTWQ
jgi:hypothetical protein